MSSFEESPRYYWYSSAIGDQASTAGQLSSYAIVGALALYLDFANLFLFLLQFTGNRRDSWS